MTRRPPKPENGPSSPRFKSRKPNQEKANELSDDLGPIMAELQKQSDRGAAIIAGSLLEQILETAIKGRLRALSTDQHKALFGRMAPLSTFSAKIEIGFAIGLYTEATYRNLNMLRQVRNEFAHKLGALSFDHPDIAKIINDPKRTGLLTSRGKPRADFMTTFAVLGALLLAMKFHDVRLPHVSETHGQVLQQMSQALDAALRQAQASRQAEGPGNTTPTSSSSTE